MSRKTPRRDGTDRRLVETALGELDFRGAWPGGNVLSGSLARSNNARALFQRQERGPDRRRREQVGVFADASKCTRTLSDVLLSPYSPPGERVDGRTRSSGRRRRPLNSSPRCCWLRESPDPVIADAALSKCLWRVRTAPTASTSARSTRQETRALGRGQDRRADRSQGSTQRDGSPRKVGGPHRPGAWATRSSTRRSATRLEQLSQAVAAGSADRGAHGTAIKPDEIRPSFQTARGAEGRVGRADRSAPSCRSVTHRARCTASRAHELREPSSRTT